MPGVSLSPPEYIFRNEIAYTIGQSNCVTVGDLIQNTDGSFNLSIKSCNSAIAKALRAILPVSKDFGGIIVNVIVSDCTGVIPYDATIVYTPESLATTFCTALKGNPLFKGVVIPNSTDVPPTVSSVVVIIDKAVVQFYADNISDLCSNYNEVAAKTFTNVSTLTFNTNLTASYSTFDPNCLLQKNIYCNSCGIVPPIIPPPVTLPCTCPRCGKKVRTCINAIQC